MFLKKPFAITSICVLLIIQLILMGSIIRVEAGKTDKIILGLAVGHALQSRIRDNSFFRLLIPLRVATEAWKKFGEMAAHHGHYDHHDHYGHHSHHHGHHLEHFDLFKA